MVTPPARAPRTVTEADDGVNGPGSASERLVATYAGKRGSIGVSNSPLLPSIPASTGVTPSAEAASTAGISRTRASRHGRAATVDPSAPRPRAARAKSSTVAAAVHAGE